MTRLYSLDRMHYHRKRWEIPLSFQMMAKVEIRDVAIAYNNRVSLETYLIVLRNELLEPWWFTIWFHRFWSGRNHFSLMKQLKLRRHLSSNVCTIYDEEMEDFSNSPTRSLTLDKQERWHDTCSFCRWPMWSSGNYAKRWCWGFGWFINMVKLQIVRGRLKRR